MKPTKIGAAPKKSEQDEQNIKQLKSSFSKSLQAFYDKVDLLEIKKANESRLKMSKKNEEICPKPEKNENVMVDKEAEAQEAEARNRGEKLFWEMLEGINKKTESTETSVSTEKTESDEQFVSDEGLKLVATKSTESAESVEIINTDEVEETSYMQFFAHVDLSEEDDTFVEDNNTLACSTAKTLFKSKSCT